MTGDRKEEMLITGALLSPVRQVGLTPTGEPWRNHVGRVSLKGGRPDTSPTAHPHPLRLHLLRARRVFPLFPKSEVSGGGELLVQPQLLSEVGGGDVAQGIVRCLPQILGRL